jgi:hypothetical protein
MRDGGFREPDELGEVAHAQLLLSQRVEQPDTCRIPEDRKRRRQGRGRALADEPGPERIEPDTRTGRVADLGSGRSGNGFGD